MTAADTQHRARRRDDSWNRHAVYVTTLLAAASSSALLVAPVAAHRLLFQGGHKRELVGTGHRITLVALAALGVTLAAGCCCCSTSPWAGPPP